MNSIFDSLSEIAYNKQISEKEILNIIKEMLLAAYTRKYGTDVNGVVDISKDKKKINVYSRKSVVEKVADSLLEISIKDAIKIKDPVEIGDEVLVDVDITKLGRNAIYQARKVVKLKIDEIHRSHLYVKFLEKKGHIINAKVQRERNGNYFLDLGNAEGILSYRDKIRDSHYYIGQSLKVLVKEVVVEREQLKIYVSRIDILFIQRLFEMEIPEIQENKIKIEKIVRDPGYKIKIAVSSKEIEPVGTCIGLKGVRIGVILKEIEGEQIDVIRYSSNIKEYIQNNFLREKISKIVIEDESEKKAIIIVNSSSLATVIGRKGRNIRLVSKLTEWSLSIKSTEEAKDLLLQDDYKKAVESVFSNSQYIGEHSIEELKGLSEEILEKLKLNGLNTLEKIVQLSKDDLLSYSNLEEKDVDEIIKLIELNVMVVEEDNDSQDTIQVGDLEEIQKGENSEEYNCPQCNAIVMEEDQNCKGCGVEIVFE